MFFYSEVDIFDRIIVPLCIPQSWVGNVRNGWKVEMFNMNCLKKILRIGYINLFRYKDIIKMSSKMRSLLESREICKHKIGVGKGGR